MMDRRRSSAPSVAASSPCRSPPRRSGRRKSIGSAYSTTARPIPAARRGGMRFASRCAGRFSRTSPSATRGRVPAPPHPDLASLRPDRIGSGAQRTPSCWRREVALVLVQPIHRSIDGGGLSGLACGSSGLARSTREKVADVHCGSGFWGAASVRVWHITSRRWGPMPLPEVVRVAYPPPPRACP